MKPFTNTIAGRKRHARVCNVIRDGLGLSSLPTSYNYPKDKGYAGTLIKRRGWGCWLSFFPAYFVGHDFHEQVETIIHEMLHVSMHPVCQAVLHHVDGMPKKAGREFELAFDRANEIVADHMTGAVLKLLWPQIVKAAR